MPFAISVDIVSNNITSPFHAPDWYKDLILEKIPTSNQYHSYVNNLFKERHKFDEVISTLMLSYVNNRLEFYNKMEDPKIKDFISDLLYQDLKIQWSKRL